MIAAMSSEPKRFVSMDGLRGVAALCVFVMHLSLCLGAPMLSGAGVSVDVFFCLSGFVLAGAYEPALDSGLDARNYLCARLTRLYPMYAIGLVAGFALHVTLLLSGNAVTGWPGSAVAFTEGALMLPLLFRTTTGDQDIAAVNTAFPFNVPSWSLFFECAANLAFAWFRPRGLALAAFLALCFALLAASAVADGRMPGLGVYTFTGGFPRALFGFYMGVGLRRLWESGRVGSPRLGGLAPLLVVALAFQPFGAGVARDLLAAAIGAPTIVWLSTHDPRSPLVARVYSWLGRMSYPLYALHWPTFGLFAFLYRRASGTLDATPLPIAWVVLFAILLVLGCGAIAEHLEPRLRRAMLARLNGGRTQPHGRIALLADGA